MCVCVCEKWEFGEVVNVTKKEKGETLVEVDLLRLSNELEKSLMLVRVTISYHTY